METVSLSSERGQRAVRAAAMAATAPKPFGDGAGSLHDLSTYAGRVAHYFDMVDLRNAFTPAAEVTRAAALLAAHKAGAPPKGTTDAELWQAKKGERRRRRGAAFAALLTRSPCAHPQSRSRRCTPTRAR